MSQPEPVGQSRTWVSQFPKVITDPCGPTYVLAMTEEEALAEATSYWDAEEIEKVIPAGWMHHVSYPEDYSSREEWEQSPDFTESWWEACAAPVNDRQRAVRAWEVIRV